MNDNENKSSKTFSYRLGQILASALATIAILCVMSLLIGFTVATLLKLF